MTKEAAQTEAQALANDTGVRYLVFHNRSDRRPVYEVCAANEANWWIGPHFSIDSHHNPAH